MSVTADHQPPDHKIRSAVSPTAESDHQVLLQQEHSKPPDNTRNISAAEVSRDWKFHREDVLKEVFEMCDKDGDEKLAEKEMGRALRFLGLNPTEPQIREMIIEHNTPKGKLTFEQFVSSLENAIGSWSMFEDLMVAFSVFDPCDTGHANRAELKENLTMLGEPLAEEEAEDWLSLVETNSRGDVNYQLMVKEVLRREGFLGGADKM